LGEINMGDKENLDQHIDAYDDKHIFSYDMKIWMNWYVKRLKEILKGKKCLELGIGHGYTTNTFSSCFNEYTVIEGSKQMIERYFKLFPSSNVKIELGYFEDFKTEEKFDVILMGYVLEHVDNPKLILKKYKKYLSANGSIYVVVPNGSALNRRFGLKAGYIKSLDEMSDFDYKGGHKRTFTYESLMQLVKDCDLETAREEGIFLKCMSTEQMLKLNISESIINAMCEVAVDFPEIAACVLLELKN
jgi:2-polyprenyl-3-methyl-5-hydroxy-6-metoxy-1,4-benzoquinol methylase